VGKINTTVKKSEGERGEACGIQGEKKSKQDFGCKTSTKVITWKTQA
jgi:hypothetical protein